jgi:excisionase family DNA binding protein
MEVNENEIYTPEEAKEILKVSSSTMTRLIKQGFIRAAKIGKQYRIMGKEILRAVSPKLEDQVGKIYNKGRRWIHEGIDDAPKTKDDPKIAV